MRPELAAAFVAVDRVDSLTLDEALTLIDRLRAKCPRRYMIGDALTVACSSVEISVMEERRRDPQPGAFLVSQDLSIKIDGTEWGGKLTSATLRIRPNEAVMLDLERIVD